MMVEVNYSIWNENKGFKNTVYKFDTSKNDMEIIIDGELYAKQSSKFDNYTDDWNCDGDIYTMYGAYFKIEGYENFLTLENVVRMIVEEGAIVNNLIE